MSTSNYEDGRIPLRAQMYKRPRQRQPSAYNTHKRPNYDYHASHSADRCQTIVTPKDQALFQYNPQRQQYQNHHSQRNQHQRQYLSQYQHQPQSQHPPQYWPQHQQLRQQQAQENYRENDIDAIDSRPSGFELLTNLKALRTRREDVIASLYDPSKYMCPTCSLRLEKAEGKVEEHLDQHFAEMQVQRTNEDVSSQPSRTWFSTESEWTVHVVTDPNSKSIKPEITPNEPVAPSSSSSQSTVIDEPIQWVFCNTEDVETCVGCGEEIPSEWKDEEDSWVYTEECLRMSTNRIAHITCTDDARRNMTMDRRQ